MNDMQLRVESGTLPWTSEEMHCHKADSYHPDREKWSTRDHSLSAGNEKGRAELVP